MRRLLALVVIVAAVSVGPAPTVAGACSCAAWGVAEQVAYADVVLVGVVVDQEPSGETEVHDAVRNTVAVERLYDGEAPAEVVVFGGEVSSGACEYAFEEGRYLVFALEDDDGLHTDLCTGTRPLTADEAVPAELGRGSAPLAEGPEPEAPPAPAPGTAATPGPGGAAIDEDGSAGTDRALPAAALVGGAVLVLAVGAAALVVVRRRTS
ncbi:hypothetical protein HC251_16210 [Iamia sp. SCSIO 61187]|uniref:hypothetical protein n=1 Tax=Iamia sp. SCSIO 61187 TaxID=2722752 RepID=UPI001C638F7E|nr:hypothetical protein [Iamia sp. SCSIO 61187]QYG93816.1 hypothetical protein HC251_16210 [Iamia sp. SCSIO 61187]